MTQLHFYQVSESPFVPVLAAILGKSVDIGLRTLVRGVSLPRIEKIDKDLWCLGGDSFLPHGMAGGEYEEDQPIVLCVEKQRAPAADGLVSIDGASVGLDEASRFQRISFVFEKRVSDDLDSARKHWKMFSDSGYWMHYWAEAGGRWKKAAESNTPASAGE